MVVKINLKDTYTLVDIAANLTQATFTADDKNGKRIIFKIIVDPLENLSLPNVYNLSFGPPKENGRIDDTIQIHHQNLNKLFSTIIFFCLNFLQKNPKVTIGLDGSSDTRAYLYHRIFCSNKEYLDEYFVASGVDWFVRLLRNGDYERHADGSAFFKPKPEYFDYNRPARDLYRFYMFYLRTKNS